MLNSIVLLLINIYIEKVINLKRIKIKTKHLLLSIALLFSGFSLAQIITTFPYVESFESGGPDNTTELPSDWTVITNGTDSPLNKGFLMNSDPNTGLRAVSVSGVLGVSLEAWIISPEIEFLKGETYIIRVSYKNDGTAGATANIGIGDTPTSSDIGKTFIWDISTVDNDIYNEVEIVYSPLDNDKRHIGIVVTSFGRRNTQNFFDTFSIEKKTLSNPEFEKDFVSIAPNPVSDFFELKFKDLTNNVSLNIYDSLGKRVMKEENIKFNHVINVSRLSKGLYFAKIEDDTGRSLVKKIIKK